MTNFTNRKEWKILCRMTYVSCVYLSSACFIALSKDTYSEIGVDLRFSMIFEICSYSTVSAISFNFSYSSTDAETVCFIYPIPKIVSRFLFFYKARQLPFNLIFFPNGGNHFVYGFKVCGRKTAQFFGNFHNLRRIDFRFRSFTRGKII